MNAVDPTSPAFLRYYASVLQREADIRAPSTFSDFLRAGAERALTQAGAGPRQPDLFGDAA